MTPSCSRSTSSAGGRHGRRGHGSSLSPGLTRPRTTAAACRPAWRGSPPPRPPPCCAPAALRRVRDLSIGVAITTPIVRSRTWRREPWGRRDSRGQWVAWEVAWGRVRRVAARGRGAYGAGARDGMTRCSGEQGGKARRRQGGICGPHSGSAQLSATTPGPCPRRARNHARATPRPCPRRARNHARATPRPRATTPGPGSGRVRSRARGEREGGRAYPGRLRAESCSPEVTPRTDASGPV